MRFCPQCDQEFSKEVKVCPADGTPTLSTREQLEELVGKTLDGRWELKSLLGCGGMGAVYRAEQLSVSRAVAVKVIKTPMLPDPRLVARFFREAKVLSALRHPHIVRLIDFGQEESSGVLFLVMELLPGKSLHAVLEKRGTFTLLQLLSLGEQLMSALAEAHKHGIVHRDLKPRNIMIESIDGVGLHLTLLDFGIARTDESAQEQLTRTGALQGTPRYMAPEQVQSGEITPRTDLYAIGILLYRLLSGHEPIKAESLFEMMIKQVKEIPPPLRLRWAQPEPVNEALCGLVDSLLAKEPSARPESALAVLSQFKALRMEQEAELGDVRRSSTVLEAVPPPLTESVGSAPSHTRPPRAEALTPLRRTVKKALPPVDRPRAMSAGSTTQAAFEGGPSSRRREVLIGALLTVLLIGGLGVGAILVSGGVGEQPEGAPAAPEEIEEEPAQVTEATAAPRVEAEALPDAEALVAPDESAKAAHEGSAAPELEVDGERAEEAKDPKPAVRGGSGQAGNKPARGPVKAAPSREDSLKKVLEKMEKL